MGDIAGNDSVLAGEEHLRAQECSAHLVEHEGV